VTANRVQAWFTVADLVTRWRFSPAKIRRLIRQGRLPGSRLRAGQAVRVKRSDVLAFERGLKPGARPTI
jgi:excisionase family DNA binding protein